MALTLAGGICSGLALTGMRFRWAFVICEKLAKKTLVGVPNARQTPQAVRTRLHNVELEHVKGAKNSFEYRSVVGPLRLRVAYTSIVAAGTRVSRFLLRTTATTLPRVLDRPTSTMANAETGWIMAAMIRQSVTAMRVNR